MRSDPTAKHRLLLLVAAALVACGPPPPVDTGMRPAPADGREVVRRMHEEWAGRWYSSIRWEQRNTLVRAGGGESVSEWVQHAALPGRLRIDYRPLERRSGVLYERGRVHSFVDGRRVATQPRVNVRLLLGADVHASSPDSVIAILDSLGMDLGVLHERNWEARPVWVVGAAPGDTTRDQFWVDAERWILVRLIQRETAGERTWVDDLRLRSFAEQRGIPVPMEVDLARDGTVILRERVTAVTIDPALDSALFDAARWTAVPVAALERP